MPPPLPRQGCQVRSLSSPPLRDTNHVNNTVSQIKLDSRDVQDGWQDGVADRMEGGVVSDTDMMKGGGI